MKIISKQRNSRMCAICGLDNLYGTRAPFYNMEDGSCMSLFRFAVHHQSYPGRVHGGIITAMLDEMGLRGMWAQEGTEEHWGVTMSLASRFRKPVPYDCDLLARGRVLHNSPKFIEVESEIFDLDGTLLANASVKCLKLKVNEIAAGVSVHEEMPYLIADGRSEIPFDR